MENSTKFPQKIVSITFLIVKLRPDLVHGRSCPLHYSLLYFVIIWWSVLTMPLPWRIWTEVSAFKQNLITQFYLRRLEDLITVITQISKFFNLFIKDWRIILTKIKYSSIFQLLKGVKRISSQNRISTIKFYGDQLVSIKNESFFDKLVYGGKSIWINKWTSYQSFVNSKWILQHDSIPILLISNNIRYLGIK